jgi:thioredoxin 2
MVNTAYILRCQSCQTLNRVPREKAAEHPVCGSCKAALKFPSTTVTVRSVDFDREVLSWPGRVLVEFFDQFCLHCQKLDPEIELLAERMQGKLKIVKVDMQRDQLLSLRYGVTGTPTFIIFRDSQQRARIDGSPGGITELEQWVLESSLKHY